MGDILINEGDEFVGQLAGRTGPVGSPDFRSASCDAYQTRHMVQGKVRRSPAVIASF